MLNVVAVALHTEGVDRNRYALRSLGVLEKSPSTRRAWIEIATCQKHGYKSVSPSTRRAWIEITSRRWDMTGNSVALHTEGVDRN